MGWAGLIFLGAVIGAAAWWLHPVRRARRGAYGLAGGPVVAMAAGVIAVIVARMAGNVAGVWHDGDTLEWFACTLTGLLAVSLTVALAVRR
jgi:hypothetical protein